MGIDHPISPIRVNQMASIKKKARSLREVGSRAVGSGWFSRGWRSDLHGWWNQVFHRRILKAGRGRMSKNNTQSNSEKWGTQFVFSAVVPTKPVRLSAEI
jgi:hypothetical protein